MLHQNNRIIFIRHEVLFNSSFVCVNFSLSLHNFNCHFQNTNILELKITYKPFSHFSRCFKNRSLSEHFCFCTQVGKINSNDMNFMAFISSFMFILILTLVLHSSHQLQNPYISVLYTKLDLSQQHADRKTWF